VWRACLFHFLDFMDFPSLPALLLVGTSLPRPAERMNANDDDILIREGSRSVGVGATMGNPKRLVVSSQEEQHTEDEEDRSTATSTKPPSPIIDTSRNERFSSNRRRGGVSKVYMGDQTLRTVVDAETAVSVKNKNSSSSAAAAARVAPAGADNNAFAALATMLNFHDSADAAVASAAAAVPSTDNDGQKRVASCAGPSSPSSLSSVSESPERSRQHGTHRPSSRPQDFPSKEQEGGSNMAAARHATSTDPTEQHIQTKTTTQHPARRTPKVTNSKADPIVVPPASTLRKKATVSHSFRSIVGSR
jgi:hypothetical protein